MFLASNIYCVNSGTVSDLYYYAPLAVSGEKPIMKKCNLGKGIKLTANFLKSEFN